MILFAGVSNSTDKKIHLAGLLFDLGIRALSCVCLIAALAFCLAYPQVQGIFFVLCLHWQFIIWIFPYLFQLKQLSLLERLGRPEPSVLSCVTPLRVDNIMYQC